MYLLLRAITLFPKCVNQFTNRIIIHKFFLYFHFSNCLMNISIIGTGNCATVLARLSKQKGHQIRQIIGRDISAAKALAAELDSGYADIKDAPDKNVDLVIFAISDSSLTDALKGISFGSTPVVHTAGAVSMEALQTVSENYGVLYPLQSLGKNMREIPPIPFIIEGNNEAMLDLVKRFAFSLSDSVQEMSCDKRLRLHAAAVIVNNFTNYIYGVAQNFCNEENVDFHMLLPLIKETAERIQNHSAAEVQTGPAIRKDITTLDKHLRLLTTHPKLRTMYLRLSDGIMNP